jgi:hypothetical protein
VTALPPYDPDVACSKCGHDDVGTQYQANAHHVAGSRCPLADLRDPECCTAEHHHRTCQRCGYLWPESVKETS